MSCIVIATDLSPRSDTAMLRAFRLGLLLGLPVRVLSVIDDELPQEFHIEQLDRTERQLDSIVARHAPKGLEVSIDVIAGNPASAVPRAVADAGAVLTVLGLHRRLAILDMLRETTMERLVRLLRSPVLLVCRSATQGYGQVLAPVSFSPACARALTTARWIGPEARISAFHALHIPYTGLIGEGPDGPVAQAMADEAQQLCDDWMAQQPLPAGMEPPQIVTGGLRQVFDRQLHAAEPDLIAIGAHTRGGLAPFTLGSFAAELIRNPPCDLLIARP